MKRDGAMFYTDRVAWEVVKKFDKILNNPSQRTGYGAGTTLPDMERIQRIRDIASWSHRVAPGGDEWLDGKPPRYSLTAEEATLELGWTSVGNDCHITYSSPALEMEKQVREGDLVQLHRALLDAPETLVLSY